MVLNISAMFVRTEAPQNTCQTFLLLNASTRMPVVPRFFPEWLFSLPSRLRRSSQRRLPGLFCARKCLSFVDEPRLKYSYVFLCARGQGTEQFTNGDDERDIFVRDFSLKFRCYVLRLANRRPKIWRERTEQEIMH